MLAAGWVAAVATVELVWWNAASTLNAERPAYYSVLQQPAGEEAAALAVLEREIEARRKEGGRPRVEVVGVSGPWQNLAMTRGLEATNGYNPLRIGRYDRLVSPGETTHLVDQRLFPASFDGYDCALARELGLEYVVLGRPIEQVPHLARRPVSDIAAGGPEGLDLPAHGPRAARAIDQPRHGGRHRCAGPGRPVPRQPGGRTALIDAGTAPIRNYWRQGRGERARPNHLVAPGSRGGGG